MKLLLHICCAPCVIFPLDIFRQNGISVTGFFYNPNIHPPGEYRNRKTSLNTYSESINLEVIYPEYKPEEYFRKIVNPVRDLRAKNTVSNRVNNQSAPKRCEICFRLRLGKTAQFAKDNGFDSFTTTLLVSPYQDQELLKQIGTDLSKAIAIDFYYEDFRSGFREAHALAKRQGIYCQNYCGCTYSEIERCRKSAKP